MARYARRVLVLAGAKSCGGDVRSVFAHRDTQKTYLRPPDHNLAQRLGRHSIPPGVLGVRELYELLVKMRREKIGCCN